MGLFKFLATVQTKKCQNIKNQLYYTVQCTGLKYTVQWTGLMYYTVQCTGLMYYTVQCTGLMYYTVQYTGLMYYTVQCTSLMYFSFFGNVSFGVYTEIETRIQPSDRSEWVLSIEYSNLA